MTRVLAILFASMLLVACKGDGKSGEASKGEGETASPGLEMSSDSAACKQAMKCCEELVKAKEGKLTPESVNLKCSGVALAETDEECGQFKQGYAAGFEGKDVPEVCK